ncbi:C25 family cysteine peptidase [Jiulongibacter sediminis]|uniref:putative type IX secretion system sortase PorU2 n=1 Tax=Jiulongibacter sediminis TaxID=1605367 RepID=UPI0026F378D3|nr:C25 family cysteine peptidase [Jiulongibacter sediminis]
MKTRLLAILLLLPLLANSQSNLGNEWIRPNQNYIKILTTEDGIYRVYGSEIITAGWELSQITPDNLQLFFLGKEMAIEVSVGNDGRFDEQDFIAFYGQRNKGFLDSLVYRPFSARLNAEQSLFSDESAYFLTEGTQTGKRVEKESLEDYPVRSYHIGQTSLTFKEQYSFNNIIGLLPNLQQSYYEDGEGWTGEFLSADSVSITRTIPVSGFVNNTGEKVNLMLQLNGRSGNVHRLSWDIDGISQDTLVFYHFDKHIVHLEVPENLIIDGKLNLTFYPIKNAEYDWFSITQIKLTYPQQITASGEYLNTNQATEIFWGGGELLNVKDPWSVSKPALRNTNQYALEGQSSYMINTGDKTPVRIETFEFRNVNSLANYYILTALELKSGAEAFSGYRSSAAGGSYDTEILYTQELYDLFTYGFRNPLAINRFSEYVASQNETKFLFLLGRPVTFPDVLKEWLDQDLVPSFGYPGSDVLLTAGTGGKGPNVQGMATGRMNVTTNSEIINYLNKVKETEAQGIAQEWKKNVLHLSGGKSTFEIESLASMLKNIKPQAEDGFLGGEVKELRKKTFAEVEPVDITNEVNRGVGLITFAGHGSSNVIDLNIGYSSKNAAYDNKGKYPVMYFNGCGVGNVFYRYDPLTTDWLITPDKGAIAVFANSFWSYLFSTQVFLNSFYENLFVNTGAASLTLGELHMKVNEDLSILETNPFIKANMHQVVLQGDPAIRMFPLEAPDYVLNKDQDIILKATDTSKPLSQNDEILVETILGNFGKYDSTAVVDVELEIQTSESTEFYVQTISDFKRWDTLQFSVPLQGVVEKVTFTANPQQTVEEIVKDNNSAELRIDNWEEVGAGTSFPANLIPDIVAPLLSVKLDGRQVVNKDNVGKIAVLAISLIDENSFDNTNVLRASISADAGNLFIPLQLNVVFGETSNILVGTSNLNLEPGYYILRIQGADASGNTLANPYFIEFSVSAERSQTEMTIYSSPLITNQRDGLLTFKLVDIQKPRQVDYSIVDILGRVVLHEEVDAHIGQNEVSFSTKLMPPGTYFLKLMVDWRDETEVLNRMFFVH